MKRRPPGSTPTSTLFPYTTLCRAALGKMTHFAGADDDPGVTREQLRVFDDVTRDLPGGISVCNSAATLTPGLWAERPDQAEQWVRPDRKSTRLNSSH